MTDTLKTEGRYRLNPSVIVRVCSSDEVLIRQGHRSGGSSLLADPNARGRLGPLVSRLREGLATTDLSELARSSEDAENIEVLLTELVSAGIAVEESWPALSGYWAVRGETILANVDATIGVLGSGVVAQGLVEELTASHAGRLAVAPSGVEGEAFFQNVFSVASMVVLALDHYSPAALHMVNELALASKTPWVPVFLDGPACFVGPPLVPGVTACFAEVEAQLEATLLHRTDYEAALRQTEHGGPVPVTPGLARAAVGLATCLLSNHLELVRDDAPARLIVLDFDDFSVDYVEILRLPRCPACQEGHYQHTFQ